jgi:hypothetical protein
VSAVEFIAIELIDHARFSFPHRAVAQPFHVKVQIGTGAFAATSGIGSRFPAEQNAPCIHNSHPLRELKYRKSQSRSISEPPPVVEP